MSLQADKRQRNAERSRAAIQFRENMVNDLRARGGGVEPLVDRDKQADVEQTMQNTGGFDASDLMAKPEMAQQSTRDQANKVSEPYREANMMAADKTNPMNAVSQNPGETFLIDYLQGSTPSFKNYESILVPRQK